MAPLVRRSAFTVCIPQKLFLTAAVLVAQFVGAFKNVTIHIAGGSLWWKTDARTWPCLENSDDGRILTFNNYGCEGARYRKYFPISVWTVPERQGPVRLASHPNLCLDAGRAIAFLQRNETINYTIGLESLLHRVITLRPCSGNVSQDFIREYRGKKLFWRLASMPLRNFMLNVEMSTLVLNIQHFRHYEPRHTEHVFILVEHRSPVDIFAFGGAIETRTTVRAIYVIKFLCIVVYILHYLKQLFGFRLKMFVEAVKLTYSALKKKRSSKVRAMIEQRRVRRAAYTLRYGAHLCAIWMIYRTTDYTDDWIKEDLDSAYDIDFETHRLTDSELVPVLTWSMVCVLFQVRPVKSARTLDGLTCALSAVWAFQYYLMSQNLSGTNIHVYLFNESWMVMLLTCINLVIGRVAVAVPCTIGVTAVDVYCKHSLTALHNHFDYITQFYLMKQVCVCALVCTLQICLERLSYSEVEATIDSRQAYMYEQLATRLTLSVYDAVAHLNDSLHFAKPAPKLGHILLRGQLGVNPTDFLNLVVPEDHSSLKTYIESAASVDTDMPLLPISVRLLDATCSCVRVKVFASAYCDDSRAQHYILGIGEIEEMEGTPPSLPIAPLAQNYGCSDRIPENSPVESDTSADALSDSSDISERTLHVFAFDFSICQLAGNILSHDAAFGTFMKKDTIVGTFFPSLFDESSAVWEWLQTKIDLVGAGQTLSEHDRTSRTFFIMRRGKKFNADIVVGDVAHSDDGASSLSLQVRVMRQRKRQASKGSLRTARKVTTASETSIAAPDLVLMTQMTGFDIGFTFDAVLDSFVTLFAAVLAERWNSEVQDFLNQVTDETMEEVELPMRRSHGIFHVDVDREHDERYTVAMHLTMRQGTDCYQRVIRALSRSRDKKSLSRDKKSLSRDKKCAL